MAEADPNVVDANQRYASACTETVARIQGRDLAASGFVAVATGLVSVAFTKTGYEFIGVSVGYVAVAAALLSCHHDIIIGLLGLFQHNLCKREESPTNWFSRDTFDKVLEARKLRDWYFTFIVGVPGILGLIISWHPALSGDHWLVKIVIWACSALSVAAAEVYIWYAYSVRKKLHKAMHEGHEYEKASHTGEVATKVCPPLKRTTPHW